ncbi:zinc finger protein ZFP2-like isoform X2 [Ptychodera flava]|uniref:zinc finger protein ZFP2-like isoform X2 n=1 Tax=Ptychodera flava TaxID=63121 RepID=UPI003969F735
MAWHISKTSTLSRAVMIDSLFDRGEELMEKLGCQVFILVSEDGICSSFMGSEVFLKKFCSSGLKVKPHDVLRMRKIIQTQPNFWIAEDNGCSQQILYRSKQQGTDSNIYNNQSVKCEIAETSHCSYDTISMTTVNERVEMDGHLATNDMNSDLINDRKGVNDDYTKQKLVSESDVATLDEKERTTSVSIETDANWENSDTEAISDVSDETISTASGHSSDIAASPCNQNNEKRNWGNPLDCGDGKVCEKDDIKTKEVNFATQEGAVDQQDMPKKSDMTRKQRNLTTRDAKKTRKEKKGDSKEKRKKTTRVVSGRRHYIRRKISSEKDVEHHREMVKKIFTESNDNAVYLCERCGLSFKSSGLLEVHQQRAACSERKCRFCRKKFPYREWQEHLLNYHVTELIVYECHVCEKQFWQHATFYNHVKVHQVNGNPFTCNECGATFTSTKSLRRHKVIHNGREHKCDFCEYKTYYKYQLNIHMKRHSDSEAFDCKFCGKHLVSLGSLSMHIQRFHILSKYQCTDCGKEFAFQRILNEHRARHHQDNINCFICEKCGKGFHTKTLLHGHLRQTHSESPVQCEVCGKQFKHRSKLWVHSRIHNKAMYQSHQCELCPRKFLSRSNVKMHMISAHSDERPHQCELCGYSCKLKGNLTKHMKVHNRY